MSDSSASTHNSSSHTPSPSAWLRRHAHHIRPGGQVLDLACGHGRNARWLAQQGLQVHAVDIDQTALDSLCDTPAIQPLQADLEQSAWPYGATQFDAIVVGRYLHRPLLPLLPASLAVGGILIYETFMQGQQQYGRPQRDEFLLRENELLDIYSQHLEVLAFEQGLLQEAPPAMLQRICARKNA